MTVVSPGNTGDGILPGSWAQYFANAPSGVRGCMPHRFNKNVAVDERVLSYCLCMSALLGSATASHYSELAWVLARRVYLSISSMLA